MDVFDNIDLSSNSSSDSDEFKYNRLEKPKDATDKDLYQPKESKVEPEHKKAFGFIKINRPPSRHRTPPKATGLEIPAEPHTPPKTQKELEEFKGYSHTINVKGINYLTNKPLKNNDSNSDYDSFSSSMSLNSYLVEEIKDIDDKKYESPEIIITHNGKQISTPKNAPLLATDAFSNKATVSKNNNHRKPEMLIQAKAVQIGRAHV